MKMWSRSDPKNPPTATDLLDIRRRYGLIGGPQEEQTRPLQRLEENVIRG